MRGIAATPELEREHRRKQSEAMTGKQNPAKRPEVRAKISKSKAGKRMGPHPEKRRQNISDGQLKFNAANPGFWAGPNNPAWRGGTSFEPYSPEWTESLRECVRDRDGRRCVTCTLSEEKNGRRLDVHHKDGDKQNCDEDNLESLCMSCHASLDGEIYR